MLVHEYELFMMHDNENISDMFTRFTTIINSLKNLCKSYPNHELVRKILRCLPKSWTPKGHPTPTKKTFKKYPHKEESIKKEELICYECKKPGYFKSDCLSLKKKSNKSYEHSKKKKSMGATWDDSDESSSDEESDGEVANIAFMAIEDEEEDGVHFSFDELQDAYENLFHEYKNVCLKNKSLKKNAISMLKEIETLKNENNSYINEIENLNVSLKLSNDSKEENENLKLEIDALKKTFSNFSNSSDKLDNLLGLQRCVFDKAGLGYEEMNNVTHFNNFFVKKNEPKIICNYCGRL
ncbi:LOW QUALITY PROTEIN: UBN2 domain-containing protein [Cephalotus follicularis]|uniref:UBN2 domain-containing protein n=1 Tax=Cephalotus follicularis TaxID=3775 RepID=A0A1Q3B0R3_CEPFO|nr:LOW QUALITY PROTEIN: UBN2 domain-containing protein [Cephalotus follicularis]